MSTISCTIRGNAVTLLADTSGSTIGGATLGMAGGSATTTMPAITAAVEVRDVLKLTVIDYAGTAVYYRGDPVVLTDGVAGVLYSGYVQTSDPTKLSPDPASTTTFHTITCMDKQYLFDKRTNNVNYLTTYSGDIAVDLVRRIGSQEGVTMAAAMDRDTVQADFAAGTLTNTVAVSNVGDGDLEIATAGSAVSFSETVTADFASGTLTNVVAANNSLTPTTTSALSFSVNLPGGGMGSFLTLLIWSGSLVIGTLDTLHYDVWIASTSPDKKIAIDFRCSDGTILSTYVTTPLYDQNAQFATPATDLSTYASDQWYSRTITFPSAFNGKTITAVYVSIAGTSPGQYQAYFKNIYLGSQSAGTKFFAPAATVTQVNPPTVYQFSTYLASSVSAGVVAVFDPLTSYRVSTAHSISAVALLRSSVVAWTAQLFAASNVTILASYDGGATYQVCTNNAPLPALPPGSNVAGLSITLKESFGAGTDPTQIPVLDDVTVTLQSAASASKSDIVTTYGTQTQLNTGTYSGTISDVNGNLKLGTIPSAWPSGLKTGQTAFFPTGTSDSVASSAYTIHTPANTLTIPGTNGFGTSRLDFMGSAINFVIDCDVSVSAVATNAAPQAGITYRQISWVTGTNNTFGYYTGMDGDQNAVEWGYGSNSTNDNYTVKMTVPVTISANTYYHLKVVVSGPHHQVYFNNAATPIIDMVDTTYQQAGGIGLRAYNSDVSNSHTSSWKNFAAAGSFGTWASPSASISALTTCGGSVISWTDTNVSTPVSAYDVVQTSIDGGSTYQICTNQGTIPGLPSGTTVTGKSILVKVTLGSQTGLPPSVTDIIWRVLGAYPGSTGTRVNPVLSLTPAGRAGASSVSWDANLPAGTSLVVATSPDNITYTPIAASGNPIASIYAQPAPQIDTFTTNTLASYTNTFKSGGSVATVTYTTASSLLTLAGGSGAVYLFTALSRADVDLICDMDRSDAGGLVWRFVNNLNYYELGIYDDSSSGGFTSQARLYKVAAGTRTLLGSASPIVFPRSTPGQSPYSRVHVTMAGAVITVFFEGVQVQTYTDGSPLAAGQMGLRNDGGTSRYYQLRLQPLGDLMTGQNLYIKETLTTSDPAQMPQLLDLTASVRGPGLATGALIPQLHAPTVPSAEFLNTEMNTITTASGDYYWNINSSGSTIGALSFVERHAVPAPWCLYSTDLIYEANVTPTSTSDLYRNRQNITNCTGVTALLHEQMVTDGSASSWKTLNPIYSAPAISVQNITQTIGVQSVDVGKQFYWTANSVSFGQDAAAVKLPAGYIIDIYYVGQFITTVTVDNAAEQTARAAIEVGTSGIIEASENGQGMLASAATTYANGLLARYGLNNAVQVVAATKRAGLAPGMLLPVFLPEHSLGNAQMLVTGVTTTMQQQADGSVLYFYQITATQGSNLANWTKVFGF